MKSEIELFKKCCFCIPLRYGLLGWGYFKMIADALMMAYATFSMVQLVRILINHIDNDELQTELVKALALPVISVLIFLADFIVTIVFIVGGHKKNPTLLSVFYYMSMVMSVHMVLKIIWCIYITIARRFFIPIFLQLLANIIGLILQIYVIFLVRNEIIKLRNQQGNRSRYNVARGGAVLDNLRTTEEAEPL